MYENNKEKISDAENELDESIMMTVREVFDGIPINDKTTAPIILPSQEQMAVKVISVEFMHRYIDASSDSELIKAIFSTMLGAFIGTVCSVLVSDQFLSNDGAKILIILTFILTVLCGLLYRRFYVRTKKLKVMMTNNGKEKTSKNENSR